MTKKPLFYKIYLSAVAVFLVLLITGLCLLNSFLKKYEAALPENVIRTIMTEYVEKGDLYGLNKLCDVSLSPYETEKTVNNAFKELSSGKNLKISSASRKLDSNSENYVITADGEELLLISLKKKSGSMSVFSSYSLSNVSLADRYYKTVTVTAPEDADIFINGIAVKGKGFKAEALPLVLKNVKDSGSLIMPGTLELKFFLASPKVEAKRNGKQLSVSENGYEFSVGQDIDKALQDKLGQFALSAAHAYAAHMQDDVPLGTVAKYVDTDTEFYHNIKLSSVSFAWDHNGYYFENDRFLSVYRYSKDYYRCRVSFTQVLKLDTVVYKDPFDKYIYIRRDGDGFKAVDMVHPEG